MKTLKNIKVQVTINPAEEIISKLANDYIVRASTHPEHELMFKATGLTKEEIKHYYVSLLKLKARQVHDERKGERIFHTLNNQLAVPIGFTPFLGAIGDVHTEEYELLITVEGDDGQIDEKNRETLRETSEKFKQLDAFMPVVRKQFKPGEDGSEAIFAIAEFKPEMDNSEVSVFAGQEVDEALLAISAVLGLKVQSQGMICLYPTFHLIETDMVRGMFVEKMKI